MKIESRSFALLAVGVAIGLVALGTRSSQKLPGGPSAPVVRTSRDGPMPPAQALDLLKEGNQRFIHEHPQRTVNGRHVRSTLATYGQRPEAVVIGCADSRAPTEMIFDAHPGDIFVLRNAGNACTHPQGSLVASVEYAVGALGTKLVLVLGHTKCGAMAGATKAFLSQMAKEGKHGHEDDAAAEACGCQTALDSYLEHLEPAARRAMEELSEDAKADEIVALAIKINVFDSIANLLEFSEPLRELVAAGEVEIHGAIYQIVSGEVAFLGQHPRQAELLNRTHVLSR